jgi:uncharacterized protein YggE
VEQHDGTKRRVTALAAVVAAAVAGSLAFAVVVGGCGAAPAQGLSATVESGSAVVASNTITVLGTATVSEVPDKAVITLSVESDGANPGAAMDANSAAVAKVLDRLKTEGVPGDSVTTTNVSVYPVRQYNQQTGEETLTGYRAQNTVTVALTDTSAVGKVLSAAVDSGVTTISGPVWELKDDTAAVVDALKKAVANAQIKAEALAGAQGVSVGAVLMMSEGTVQQPVYPVYQAVDSAAGAKAESVPVSPGSLDVTATVTVTYALTR